MKATVSVLCLVLLCSLFWAQEVVFEYYQSGTDIWVLIPYSSLSFKEGADQADYQLAVEIEGVNKKKEKASFASQLQVPKRDWLQDSAIPVKFTATLSKGDYKLHLQLRSLDLGETIKLSRNFKLDKYTPIGQAWLLAEREGQSFLPGEMWVLDQELSSCVILQKYTREVDSLRVEIGERAWVYYDLENEIEIDMMELVPLPAPIGITVNSKSVQHKMKPFIYSPWFAYNLRYDHQDQVQQIRYIATENHYQHLKDLGDDEIEQGIEIFWLSMDPSPGTVHNEAREEFCNRVIIADERYSPHKKMKGWRSDRGRIYIKFGEPDFISHPDPIPEDGYPTTVWTYVNEKKEFIFVDYSGYGQFTLQNKNEEYDF